VQLAQNAITKSGVEMKRTRRGWSVDESRMAKDWKRTKRRGRGPPNLSESTATSPQARCREARCTGVGRVGAGLQRPPFGLLHPHMPRLAPRAWGGKEGGGSGGKVRGARFLSMAALQHYNLHEKQERAP
jgi:hypothetical protein